jgi:hypothetical protein
VRSEEWMPWTAWNFFIAGIFFFEHSACVSAHLVHTNTSSVCRRLENPPSSCAPTILIFEQSVKIKCELQSVKIKCELQSVKIKCELLLMNYP